MSCVAMVQTDSATMDWKLFESFPEADAWVREQILELSADTMPDYESDDFNLGTVHVYTTELGPVWGIVVVLV